jgi:transcriptional regulator with XRE-family HTH domain
MKPGAFHFTRKLRTLRHRSAMTQQEVAFQIGVSVAQVCRWETTPITPTLRHLRKLAKCYNVSLEELSDNIR